MILRPSTLGRVPLLALLALACSEDPAPAASPPEGKRTEAPDLRDKADGAALARSLGRLRPGATTVSLDGGPVAWRIAVFPGSRLRLEAHSPDDDLDPVIVVRGPLPAQPQAVLAYNDDVAADRLDAAVELTAEATGAVEVVAGSYGQLQLGQATPGRLTVTLTCLAGCSLPELPLDALRDAVIEAGAPDTVALALPALFPDPATAAAVEAQVSAWLGGEAAVFPVLPLQALGAAQPLLEAYGGAPVEAPGPVRFDLAELLTRGCLVERARRAPVHPSLPAALTRGAWPDYSLDDCTVQRQRDFADVLNNLALDNGSAVVNGPTRYESVEDVFVALIDSGHQVVVENNRYFANFLGLNLGDAAVVAPVWIDTGVPLAGGGTLPIPAPHTHHSVYVRGPLVNADVMYYMGTDGGVSFRSDENLRPGWSGERTGYRYDSALEPDRVVRLMTLAGRLRRIWFERGQGLPAQGYGQLGVCNDSTAILEHDAEGTVTVYPLAHPGVSGAPEDQVDAILAQLPRDLAGVEPSALERIRLTLPYTGAPLPALGALVEAAGR